jgi:hypothetical protein
MVGLVSCNSRLTGLLEIYGSTRDASAEADAQGQFLQMVRANPVKIALKPSTGGPLDNRFVNEIGTLGNFSTCRLFAR